MAEKGPLIVDIDGNTAPIDAKMAKSDKALNELVKKEAAIRRNINRKIRGSLYSIGSMVGVFRASVSFMGHAMDPILDSILGAIQTSTYAAVSIHRMMDVASGGVTLATGISVALSTATILASWAMVAQAMIGMEEAKAEMARTATLVASLEMMVQTSLWMVD